MSNEVILNSTIYCWGILLKINIHINTHDYRSFYWPTIGGIVVGPVVAVASGVVVKGGFRRDQSRISFVISLVTVEDVSEMFVIDVVPISASVTVVAEFRNDDLGKVAVVIFSSIASVVSLLFVPSVKVVGTTTVVGNVTSDDGFCRVVVTFDRLLIVALINDGVEDVVGTSTDRFLWSSDVETFNPPRNGPIVEFIVSPEAVVCKIGGNWEELARVSRMVVSWVHFKYGSSNLWKISIYNIPDTMAANPMTEMAINK